MNTYRLILIFLALASVSCNAVVDEQPLEESPLSDYQGISICVSEATTRTALDSDDKDMASVKWLSDDCIYLWAKEDGATDYSFSQAEFKQKYFFETYSHAVFTADVDPMSSGTYTYFGVYPKPAGVSGSEVTFALPSEQSGLYDGELDIMVAGPVSGDALGETPDGDLALSFSHLTHAVRINIPDNRNLFGQGVRTLEVTFPGDVVGDLSFDAASNAPTPSLSNGSSVVTLNFEEELNEGDQYAWIFIAPTTLSGTLSFRAYDSNGYKSEEISTTINKTMEAGSVTPITLTVPEAIPATTLQLTIANNYLGEEIETMTITAPSGALFTNGSSEVVLPYSADGIYSVGYYTDDYDAKFKAGSLSIEYESENAIVSGDAISLSGITENSVNSFSCDVPYLFVEDFSGVSSSGSYSLLTYTYDLPGLSYWGDGRLYNYWTSNCIALKTYCSYLYVLFYGPTYTLYDPRIELNLSNLTGLKSGSTVNLTIDFQADWKQNLISSMSIVIYNDDDSQSIELSNNSNASSGSITTNRSIDLSSCNSDSVITWETSASGGSGSSSDYDYVYIDNIKISIAN